MGKKILKRRLGGLRIDKMQDIGKIQIAKLKGFIITGMNGVGKSGISECLKEILGWNVIYSSEMTSLFTNDESSLRVHSHTNVRLLAQDGNLDA